MVMLKKLAICAALLFVPLMAMADDMVEEDGNYHHSYDRFTKTHTYSWRSDYQEIGSDGKVIAHLIENPIIINNPEENSFIFTIIFRHTDDTDDYDFSECGDVNWLVDNKIIIPTNQAQLSTTETGMSGDNLFNVLNESDFKTIMNSKKAEYRVCLTNEFELDADTKKGMRRIYSEYLKQKK